LGLKRVDADIALLRVVEGERDWDCPRFEVEESVLIKRL
jgi:hypothetical protein